MPGVVQAKWENDESQDGRFKWHELLAGLQWFSKGDMLMYQIAEPQKFTDGFEDLKAKQNTWFSEQQLRDAGWKFFAESPMHTALAEAISQSTYGLFQVMADITQGTETPNLDDLSDEQANLSKWYAGTICDLSATLVMYQAMGVEAMENAKSGVERQGSVEGKNLLVSQQLKAGNKKGLLDAFDEWAATAAPGVMQIKMDPGRAVHTFNIEKIYIDENNISYKVIQSYEGLYSLNEYMNPDEEIAPKGNRKQGQVAAIKAARDAFGGGQVFGRKYMRDNVLEPLQDALAIPKGKTLLWKQEKPMLEKLTKIIGKKSTSPNIENMIVITGLYDDSNLGTFVESVMDNDELQNIKNSLTGYMQFN